MRCTLMDVLLACLWAAVFVSPTLALAANSSDVRGQFADPPRQYSTAPLWVWNDLLTEEQVRSTLGDLAGQKVRQAFVHPRPGLMTPYLGEDWFRLWKVALDEAERLDMNVWIYDENSYPSGFAGGLVPEAMPDSRGRDLAMREAKRPPGAGEDFFAVFRLGKDDYEDVTDAVRGGETMPEGRYLIASWRLAPSRAWFGGKFYVDLLKPGVTEKFIEITHDAYLRELGDHFGKRLPGVFTDEPHLCPAGGLHWNEHLAEEFETRWGYDLEEHLPALMNPLGDWKQIRHNYQQLLLEQFIEHWSKPCYEFCEKHGLEFTGHYWEHGWPGASHGPDNMAMYAWHQRPAIDNLMNQWDLGVHAQFGNSRTVKELAAVANQLGRGRTLCETYGAGGWDLRLEDMKRIGDWLYVLGVNTLDEHLSYVTIRGARKRDHPQSFSYHEPWWGSYHVMAGYFTRLSLALSAGEQVNHVLVLEPTTTAWMYQPDPSGREHLEGLGEAFQQLIHALEAAQAEYDVGCEDIIARHGSVELAGGPLLVVGERSYRTVVLPPEMENVNAETLELLEAFARAGGRVFSCGPGPTLVDGAAEARARALTKTPGWRRIEPEAAPAAVREVAADGLLIRRAENDAGLLFHHRRRLDDGEILFLVNTSIEAPSSGTIQSAMRGVEKWDSHAGTVSPYPFTAAEDGIRAGFELPPCGSLLLFLSKEAGKPTAAKEPARTAVPPADPPEVRRVGPNVLTLDYVDVTAGGETKQNVYCYQANRFVWMKHGMDGNPWDSAVQFRDELIRKKFPADSGFQATYRFTIEGDVPGPLHVVVERPDLYTITMNGKPVAAKEGDWWLDRSFGRVDVTDAARVGPNELTVKASPMTMFGELEAAYVLGDFSLRATDSGFAIIPPEPLGLGPWNEQGMPLYAQGVAYAQTFQVAKPSGRYVVSLPDWYGSVAKVSVNGQPAGHVAWRPWQCDVTGLITPGENRIEVTVIGTLKNTLGPHHGSPELGKAWPHAFQVGPETGPPPGAEYSTVGYGLFEPFVLEQIVP